MTVTRRTAIGIGVGAAATALVGTELGRKWWFDREPPSPPPSNGEGRLVWRNWSGSASSYPAVRAAPSSEAELSDLLRSTAAPIRPGGAGHSFTSLVPTDGTLISLDRMSGILNHDAAANIATVWAGTRLGELGPALAVIGLEMLRLPVLESTEKTAAEWDSLCAAHRKFEFFALPFTGHSAVIITEPTDADVIP